MTNLRSVFWHIAVLVSSHGTLLADVGNVVRETRTPLLWKRTVVIPKAAFTPEALEERFRKIVASDLHAAPVVQVDVFTNRGDTLKNCKCVTDVSYALWLDLYREYMKAPILDVATLVIIGGQASMQIRLENGTEVRRRLTAEDPLVVTTPVCQTEVRYLSESNQGLWFYVVSRQFDPRCGQGVVQALRMAVRGRHVSVLLRRDPWFITSSDFPIVDPFLRNPTPPNLASYETSREVVCSESGDAVRCRSYSPLGALP